MQYTPIFEQVHRSALDRWKGDGAYRPPNLREVLPMIANEFVPVVDWDNRIMPASELEREFGSILS